MKFLSQITSPDILDLEYLDPEDDNLEDRKIVTTHEIAHYVS